MIQTQETQSVWITQTIFILKETLSTVLHCEISLCTPPKKGILFHN